MRFPFMALAPLLWFPLAPCAAAAPEPNPFQSLAFLEGAWDANVQDNATVKAAGRYSFVRELDGHVLARHATSDTACKAPASFDCAHGDLLYVYQEAPDPGLKAIYFDNEGHVIHYDVTTPTPTSVVFLSPATGGPQFRLTYALDAGVMTGRFQMHMPGQADWRTYLEWSGKRE